MSRRVAELLEKNPGFCGDVPTPDQASSFELSLLRFEATFIASGQSCLPDSFSFRCLSFPHGVGIAIEEGKSWDAREGLNGEACLRVCKKSETASHAGLEERNWSDAELRNYIHSNGLIRPARTARIPEL